MHLGASRLQSIARDPDDDDVFHVVVLKPDGKSRTFSVDNTGQIVLEEIDQASVPGPVQKTIVSQARDAKITKLERSNEDGEVEYHATITRSSGAVSGFSVEPDGRLSSIEVDLNETPAPVRRTIESLVGAGRLKTIEKVFDGPAVEYEVEARAANGRLEKFTVGPSGTLESVKTWLQELPAPVQKTVREYIGAGKLHEIHKVLPSTPKGNVIEVYGAKDGRPFNFCVGPDGVFQGQLK